MFASEMRGLDSALNLPLCCPAQVRDQFFALVDTMFKKLNQREISGHKILRIRYLISFRGIL